MALTVLLCSWSYFGIAWIIGTNINFFFFKVTEYTDQVVCLLQRVFCLTERWKVFWQMWFYWSQLMVPYFWARRGNMKLQGTLGGCSLDSADGICHSSCEQMHVKRIGKVFDLSTPQLHLFPPFHFMCIGFILTRKKSLKKMIKPVKNSEIFFNGWHL